MDSLAEAPRRLLQAIAARIPGGAKRLEDNRWSCASIKALAAAMMAVQEIAEGAPAHGGITDSGRLPPTQDACEFLTQGPYLCGEL